MEKRYILYRFPKRHELPKIQLRPGQMIVVGDPSDLEFVRIVPDPDHQSSLDYLKGV